MKVVIGTNVLLVSFSRDSEFRVVFEAFLREEITLCVTTDILFEYEEIIGRHLGGQLAANVLRLIENAPNVEWVTNYFKWNLIQRDLDDNKFVDCAVAAGAKFLVSDDRHFQVLKKIPFPKVELLTAREFKQVLKKETGAD